MPSKTVLIKETEEQKEARLAYHRAYNTLNRAKINQQMTKKYHCDVCNKDVTKLKVHNMSNMHKKKLNM